MQKTTVHTGVELLRRPQGGIADLEPGGESSF